MADVTTTHTLTKPPEHTFLREAHHSLLVHEDARRRYAWGEILNIKITIKYRNAKKKKKNKKNGAPNRPQGHLCTASELKREAASAGDMCDSNFFLPRMTVKSAATLDVGVSHTLQPSQRRSKYGNPWMRRTHSSFSSFLPFPGV